MQDPPPAALRMQLLGNIGEYRRISRKIAKDRGDDITKNSAYTRDLTRRTRIHDWPGGRLSTMALLTGLDCRLGPLETRLRQDVTRFARFAAGR